MKPVNFPESNKVYAEDQPEYIPLATYYAKESPNGDIISCWKLNFLERLKVLFTGRIWVSLWCFHQPLTPSRLSVNKWSMLLKAYFKSDYYRDVVKPQVDKQKANWKIPV